MKRYNPSEIEPKWRKFWDDQQTYNADLASDKPKYIGMSMFNYPNENELAKGHFDRGVCTVAIGESHEGLEIAKGQNGLAVNCDEAYMERLENDLQPVEHRDGEAKFFLGAGWNRLPQAYRGWENRDIPLGYHAVKNYGKQIDENLMRWAIVRFCNPHLGFEHYNVPTPPETRPYKQLGTLTVDQPIPVLPIEGADH